MKTLSIKPKFMSGETIRQALASQVECDRCHTIRQLPPGRTAIMGICNDCCLEVEWEAKKYQGRLKEGEKRPKRDMSTSSDEVAPEAPQALTGGDKIRVSKIKTDEKVSLKEITLPYKD